MRGYLTDSYDGHIATLLLPATAATKIEANLGTVDDEFVLSSRRALIFEATNGS